MDAGQRCGAQGEAALDQAEQVAKKAGDSYVTVERLLLALALAKDTAAGKALDAAGLTPQGLNGAIDELRGGRTADTASAEDRYDALKKFARDLTEAARAGKLDPVIGRDEEIRRTVPVIETLRAAGISLPISIDTRKAAVARAALAAGADMVNDVSALGFDPEMAPFVAESGVPVCLMHASGTPDVMQQDPRYSDVLVEVMEALDRAESLWMGAQEKLEKATA